MADGHRVVGFSPFTRYLTEADYCIRLDRWWIPAVEAHHSHILDKTGARNMAQLARQLAAQ